jgi:hypothetical protein
MEVSEATVKVEDKVITEEVKEPTVEKEATE